jgi:hypothetical protein
MAATAATRLRLSAPAGDQALCAAHRQFVLRKSNDEIGRLNGWQFHRDGIHLNSHSGEILADLVQQFLDMPTGVDSPTRA